MRGQRQAVARAVLPLLPLLLPQRVPLGQHPPLRLQVPQNDQSQPHVARIDVQPSPSSLLSLRTLFAEIREVIRQSSRDVPVEVRAASASLARRLRRDAPAPEEVARRRGEEGAASLAAIAPQLLGHLRVRVKMMAAAMGAVGGGRSPRRSPRRRSSRRRDSSSTGRGGRSILAGRAAATAPISTQCRARAAAAASLAPAPLALPLSLRRLARRSPRRDRQCSARGRFVAHRKPGGCDGREKVGGNDDELALARSVVVGLPPRPPLPSLLGTAPPPPRPPPLGPPLPGIPPRPVAPRLRLRRLGVLLRLRPPPPAVPFHRGLRRRRRRDRAGREAGRSAASTKNWTPDRTSPRRSVLGERDGVVELRDGIVTGVVRCARRHLWYICMYICTKYHWSDFLVERQVTPN